MRRYSEVVKADDVRLWMGSPHRQSVAEISQRPREVSHQLGHRFVEGRPGKSALLLDLANRRAGEEGRGFHGAVGMGYGGT